MSDGGADDADRPLLLLRDRRVRDGKGAVARSIELEAKGVKALKSWLDARPAVANDLLFVNRYATPSPSAGCRSS